MVALTEVTTTELIARCRRGDAPAWHALVDRYARLVHAVALRHGLRGGEVEDVAQEVFLALARTLAEIDDPERLPGWLATTTRRASWRAVQLRRREEELDDPELDRPDHGGPSPGHTHARRAHALHRRTARPVAAPGRVDSGHDPSASPLSHTADHALPG